MKFFRKKDGIESAAPPRIKKSSTSELTAWADTCILQLGMSFDAWRYKDRPLEDCQIIVETLSHLLAEISIRNDS